MGDLIELTSRKKFTGSPPPPTGSVLRYDMETLVGSQMKDLSGNGNHGTITGTTDVAGRFGRAREFDGVNDDIVVPNEENFEFDSMTVAIWAKPDTFTMGGSRTRTIASKAQFSLHNQDWEFTFTTDGKPEFAVVDFDSVRYRATSPTPLAIGEWHHIVGVRSGSIVKVYVDAIEKASIGTAPATHNNSSTQVRIGDIDSGVTGHFDGILDEALIFSRALSDDEIESLTHLKPLIELTSLRSPVIELTSLRTPIIDLTSIA